MLKLNPRTNWTVCLLSPSEMLILLTWPQMLPALSHSWHSSQVFSLFKDYWLWISAWTIFLEVFEDNICCMCIWNRSTVITHSLSTDQFECYWDIIMNFFSFHFLPLHTLYKFVLGLVYYHKPNENISST